MQIQPNQSYRTQGEGNKFYRKIAFAFVALLSIGEWHSAHAQKGMSTFIRRVSVESGSSTSIQKINTTMLAVPSLPQKPLQDMPFLSSDSAEKIPYFEVPALYEFSGNVATPTMQSSKKLMVVSALINKDSSFWIRPAANDVALLKKVAKQGNDENSTRYAFPGLSVTPSGSGLIVTYYATTAQTQPSPIAEDYFPNNVFDLNGQAIEMKKWTSSVDFRPSAGYDVWMTLVINPALCDQGEIPCIAVYFQEAKVSSGGAVSIGKNLQTKPIAFYSDAYSSNLWTNSALRAGSGDVESSSVFDQSIGEQPFVTYPIAYNSNTGIAPLESGLYEDNQVFLKADGVILLQQYTESLPANVSRPTREIMDCIDWSGQANSEFLMLTDTILTLTGYKKKNYCGLAAQNVFGTVHAYGVPVVSTAVPKFNKPAVTPKPPELGETIEGWLYRSVALCKLATMPSAPVQEKIIVFNDWDRISDFSQTQLHEASGVQDLNEGVCTGLSTIIAGGLVEGNIEPANLNAVDLQTLYARAVPVQRDVLAAVRAYNLGSYGASLRDELAEAVRSALPGLNVRAGGWTQTGGAGGLEVATRVVAELNPGEALLIGFQLGHDERGHTIMFFRQADGRLVFMDPNAGMYIYRGRETDLQRQARTILGAASPLIQRYGELSGFPTTLETVRGFRQVYMFVTRGPRNAPSCSTLACAIM
jgi:hypothetical protein